MRRLTIVLIPLALAACTDTRQSVEDEIALAPAETTAEENLGLTGLPLAEEIATGRDIAEDQCSRCHGLDREDARRTDAPALRHVLAEYDSEALKESFRDGIKVGHPDMPEFEFSPMEVDFLLSYLVSIQEPAPEAPE